MRIVNIVCINKERPIGQCVDHIAKIFEENSETSFPGERGCGIECQLGTSKGGGKSNFGRL